MGRWDYYLLSILSQMEAAKESRASVLFAARAVALTSNFSASLFKETSKKKDTTSVKSWLPDAEDAKIPNIADMYTTSDLCKSAL